MRKLLLVLALLFGTVDARAAILQAGGEDIDVATSGTVTNTAVFRTGWARSSLTPSVTGATSDPPTNRFILPTFTDSGTIWLHVAVQQANSGATTSAAQLIRIYGSDGVARIIVRGTGTAGQVKISSRNTAATITDLVTCTATTWPPATPAVQALDLFLNYAVAGRVTLYANSVQICDFSGDVTTNGVAAVNQVEFAAVSTTNAANFSEIIVADQDTHSMGLRTLAPAASGNTQSWTPNTVANINPTAINDTNFVSTTGNNALSQWTVGALPPGTFNVLMVKQSARVIIGVTGPQNFRYSQRVSGSDHNSGSTAGTTSFANYYNYLATSPASGIAWTTSELGTGVNFGLESLP